MRRIGNLTAVLLAAFLLSGCVAKTSYRIISNSEDTARTTLFVEVPVTSTKEDMQGCANHLEKLYKIAGKGLLINFYSVGDRTDHLIGTYQGGSVRVVRR